MVLLVYLKKHKTPFCGIKTNNKIMEIIIILYLILVFVLILDAVIERVR